MAMQDKSITTIEELPMILNAAQISKLLGLSPQVVYKLMRSEGFPAIRIGKRVIVYKAAFEQWLYGGMEVK